MRFALSLALAFVFACGDDDPPTMDAMPEGGCTADAECDDGLYCNGAETCDAGTCVDGTPPCGEEPCDEEARACATGCEVDDDVDGDGARAPECGGDDCDDANPDRFPGNTEICDAMNRDEDCDPRTFGFRDLDGDGSADQACCNGDACGNDCDDADGAVNPRSIEVCNGVDDDCDGMVDEALLLEFWPDEDNDGYGTDDEGATSLLACSAPALYAGRRGDCNDDAPEIHPATPEVCDDDDVDENCDGVENEIAGEPCECTPGDPNLACELTGACTGAVRMCVDGRRTGCSIEPEDEVCDGSIDEDCDGAIDEGLTITCYPDSDSDGYALFGSLPSEQCAVDGDCPSRMTSRVPATAEGSDCDDTAPGDTLPSRCFRDLDGDSFGAGDVLLRCRCEPDEVLNDDDCCDVGPNAALAFPGARSAQFEPACESFDYNCDGSETHGLTPAVCSGFPPDNCRLSHGTYIDEPVCGEFHQMAGSCVVNSGMSGCVPRATGGSITYCL